MHATTATTSNLDNASFTYDGDGRRVIATEAGTTTVFIGNYFEWKNSAMTKYYYAGGQRLAVRNGNTSGTSQLSYLLTDHLGSTRLTYRADLATSELASYTSWGVASGAFTNTRYTYTGQYSYTGSFGLMYTACGSPMPRWYDPTLNRFAQADSIVPNPGNPMDFDRYAYVRNNPLKYADPSGHFPDFLLDLAFIAYDVVQINNEGWTLVNTVALCADVAAALIPIGTGGGPAVRAIVGGQDVATAIAQAAVQVPDIFRVGQAAETGLQFFEGSEIGEPNFPDSTGLPDLVINNSVGDPYPHVIDPRTGQPISAPPDNLNIIPVEQRVSWGNVERATFIREWYDRGYSTPTGGWELYDIHHIIPRQYGGTNSFENLVPVLREIHQQELNSWWSYYE